MRKRQRCFTLIELTTSLTLFAIIFVAAGGTFFSVLNNWTRQRNTIDLVQHARWALEFMVSEIRPGSNCGEDVSLDGIWCDLPSGGGPFNRVWYWRGDDGPLFGESSILYRGEDSGTGPSLPGQELANFISNTSPIFTMSGDLLTIELTGRPYPNQSPDRPFNKDFTVRTKVRLRN